MSFTAIDNHAPQRLLARRQRSRALARFRACPQPDDLSKSVIVFAPHQDDEVLGCGGTIIKKVASGSQVNIVFMTDGCGSHAAYITREELIALRRAEAVEAARILGVPEDRVTFLEFPDGALASAKPDALKQVHALLDEHHPQEVLVPHHLDGPSDHLATYEIVTHALAHFAHDVTVYEYAVWLWHHWPWVKPSVSGVRSCWNAMRDAVMLERKMASDFETCIDITDVREQKLAALVAHKSQMQRPSEHPDWPILSDVSNGAWLEACTQNFELFCVHT